MRLVVVDASAIVEALFGTPMGAAVTAVMTSPGADLHVPALADVEVVSALRRALAAGNLNGQRAGEALSDYLDLPLVRHGHTSLLDRVAALGHNFSAYDATYVALAEQLAAPLLTADRGLARAVSRHGAVSLALP